MSGGLGKYRKKYQPGDVLVREGERGTELFLLEQGVFDITINGRKVDSVDASQEQDFLGEVAAILETARTATVVAATECSVLCLPRFELESVLQKSPSLGVKLVRSLCRKLSGSAAALSSVQRAVGAVEKTGSTETSLRNYMKGLLFLMERAADDGPGEAAAKLLAYYRHTNPWGMQHGDSEALLRFGDEPEQEQVSDPGAGDDTPPDDPAAS